MVSSISQMGSFHADQKKEKQDAVVFKHNGDYWVISLADGVSTCEKAKAGAETACNTITELLLKKGNFFLAFDDNQIAELALSHVLCELKQQAKQEQSAVDAYSSTLASVLYDRKSKKLLYFNLGDSLILAVENGTCRVLSMPSDSLSGCCVTTTKNAVTMTEARVIPVADMEAVVICSDGAWRQFLEQNRLKPEVASLIAHQEFDQLKEYLIKQNCMDDYSFIALEVKKRKGI